MKRIALAVLAELAEKTWLEHLVGTKRSRLLAAVLGDWRRMLLSEEQSWQLG